MKNLKKILAVAAASIFVLAACENGGTSEEAKVAEQQLNQFLQSQPIPLFNSSQLRQNLIDIETAQANATITTSFFFNFGIENPVHECPSIGFPIPGTFQLTNPMYIDDNGRHEDLVLPQLESNGVYTGDTSATTVICIDDQGRGYAFYWEGSVATAAGPAKWDSKTKQMVLVGEPSAEFSTGGK
ncbi:MAG: hypothetical protein ACWGQW_05055 [bacterium]